MASPRRLFLGAVLLFIVFILLAPRSPLGRWVEASAGGRVLSALQAAVGLTAILLALLSYYAMQLRAPGSTRESAVLRTIGFTLGWLAATIAFGIVRARLGIAAGALAAGTVFAIIYVPIDSRTRRPRRGLPGG